MMIIAAILGMAMLTYYFSGVEETQHNPNSEPQSLVYSNSIEVPLKRNQMGHYVVTGTINGEKAEFLLDTGATDVVVPEEIAQQLGLPYGQRGKAVTANGVITIYRTRIESLAIGEIRLYDISASINPAMHTGAILLGMTALGQIEFSQQGNILTLKQRPG